MRMEVFHVLGTPPSRYCSSFFVSCYGADPGRLSRLGLDADRSSWRATSTLACPATLASTAALTPTAAPPIPAPEPVEVIDANPEKSIAEIVAALTPSVVHIPTEGVNSADLIARCPSAE